MAHYRDQHTDDEYKPKTKRLILHEKSGTKL